MGFLGSVLLVFAALSLQATLMPHVAVAGIRPDLPLVATVLLAYARGATGGTLAGFFIGLAQDLTNPAFLGLNAMTKALLGHATGSTREHLDASSLPIAGAVLFVSVLAHDMVYLTISSRLALSEVFHGLATRSLPTAVYTALVGVWAFMLLATLSRRGVHGLAAKRFARR